MYPNNPVMGGQSCWHHCSFKKQEEADMDKHLKLTIYEQFLQRHERSCFPNISLNISVNFPINPRFKITKWVARWQRMINAPIHIYFYVALIVFFFF